MHRSIKAQHLRCTGADIFFLQLLQKLSPHQLWQTLERRCGVRAYDVRKGDKEDGVRNGLKFILPLSPGNQGVETTSNKYLIITFG